MSVIETKSCHIGPEIIHEEFIAEHIFVFILQGTVQGYEGNRKYSISPEEYYLIRKNHLVRLSHEKSKFEKVIVVFDEKFLKLFQEKHQKLTANFSSKDAFIRINKSELVPSYINSLMPYYNRTGKIDETFADVKREELLMILLKLQPELAGVFFDYGIPEKIDLEEFMNRNYKFNVRVERLAYLTGRSLSAFKRDFKQVFNETPGHWLVKKRLQEAHFLIDKKNKKPAEIYLDLGFENLSHFSFAFKKLFGLTPTELTGQKENINRDSFAAMA